MRATTSGWEIVCPEPIGRATLSHASSRRCSGTKRSRGTALIAASTRWSPTYGRSSSTRRSAGLSPALRLRHGRTGGPQLLERPFGVARLHLHATHGGRVDADRKALAQRVERGVLDAVVGGEAD